jgi:DNA-binding NarL/FixJ family response regulator
MARLLIADDSDLLRRTIRKFLFDYPRFEVVGEARDYAETIALISRVKPDLILLDLRMPGVDSRADVARAAAACNCPVVTMTFAADGEADELAAAAGAARSLDKAYLYEELVPAMDAALRERDKTTGLEPTLTRNQPAD